jgi:hypothetical protein
VILPSQAEQTPQADIEPKSADAAIAQSASTLESYYASLLDPLQIVMKIDERRSAFGTGFDHIVAEPYQSGRM